MGLERHAGRLWASTSGGPLVLLEEAALQAWGGLETGDYDRACETIGVVAELAVGNRRGLVLGDEPAMTTVVARPEGVVCVRWHAAEDEGLVGRALEDLALAEELDGEDSGLRFEWLDSSLVLFDSVEAGDEQIAFDLSSHTDVGDGALRVLLSPGRYSVWTGMLDPAVGSLSVVDIRRT